MRRIVFEFDYDEEKYENLFTKEFVNGLMGTIKTLFNTNRVCWGRLVLEKKELGGSTFYTPTTKLTFDMSEGVEKPMQVYDDEIM